MFWLLVYFMLGAARDVATVRGVSEGWAMDKRLRFADFLLNLACAFSIAVVLMVGTTNMQAGRCSMPGQICISGSGSDTGVNVSAQQSGNSVPQTPSNSVMGMLIPITVGMATVGAVAVTIPAVGTVTVAGDVMASVDMTAVHGGIIGGVALVTLMNRIGGDVSLDSNSQVVASAAAANAGDVGFNGHQWYCSFGNVVGGGAAYGVSPDAACAAALPAGGLFKCAGIGTGSNTGALCGMATSHGNPPMCYAAYLCSTDRYVTGYIASGPSCAAGPATPKVLVTNAQIQSAIKAHPDSWPSIYDDMNCGPTLALTNGSTSDPCYRLYSDSRMDFGVSFSTSGSNWSNNGCAVSNTSHPSTTVTTAPTAGMQTRTNADGSETTTNTTTTRTTTVTGTNDRTNLVVGQTTTTTATATTVTDADGSTTTTTETTTGWAPPQTDTNTNQQQKNQTQPTTATFVSPDIKLYDKETKTFGDVLNASRNTIRASTIGAGVWRFFTVSTSGSCLQQVVPQADQIPSAALRPVFYNSSTSLVYQIVGYTVLAATAFAAFAIVFL